MLLLLLRIEKKLPPHHLIILKLDSGWGPGFIRGTQRAHSAHKMAISSSSCLLVLSCLTQGGQYKMPKKPRSQQERLKRKTVGEGAYSGVSFSTLMQVWVGLVGLIITIPSALVRVMISCLGGHHTQRIPCVPGVPAGIR